jgi:hypothetical protein
LFSFILAKFKKINPAKKLIDAKLGIIMIIPNYIGDYAYFSADYLTLQKFQKLGYFL